MDEFLKMLMEAAKEGKSILELNQRQKNLVTMTSMQKQSRKQNTLQS